MRISEVFATIQGEGDPFRRAVAVHSGVRLQSAVRVVRHAVHLVGSGGRGMEYRSAAVTGLTAFRITATSSSPAASR